MSQWYYTQAGQQHGPLTFEALYELIHVGKVRADDLLWNESMTDWKPVRDVTDMADALPARKSSAQAKHAPVAAQATAPAPTQIVQPAPVMVYATPPAAQGWNWGDFLAFRLMLAVPVIRILFYVGVTVIVLWSLFTIIVGGIGIFNAREPMMVVVGIIGAILFLTIGLLLWRLYCELAIVIFRINETLTEIKHELQRRN